MGMHLGNGIEKHGLVEPMRLKKKPLSGGQGGNSGIRRGHEQGSPLVEWNG
jgi:hypothetical protein